MSSQFEVLIQELESVSNMLLGMTLDKRIPEDTRECMRERAAKLSELVELMSEDEEMESDIW